MVVGTRRLAAKGNDEEEEEETHLYVSGVRFVVYHEFIYGGAVTFATNQLTLSAIMQLCMD
jgi:hypothetical protein